MKLGEKDRQVWQHPTLLFADRSTPNQIELGWNLLIHGSGRNTNQVLIEARSAASLPPLSHTTGVLSGLLFRVVRLDNDVYEFNVRQITIEIIVLCPTLLSRILYVRLNAPSFMGRVSE